MERSEIESALREAYARREANDPVSAGAIFAPDATYRVAGSKDHCGAVRSVSASDMGPALNQLFSVFRAKKFDITSMLIDDDHAAVTIRATFDFTPTGETISTDLAHFWTFRDGQAIELLEFLDTAHVVSLQAQVPAAK